MKAVARLVIISFLLALPTGCAKPAAVAESTSRLLRIAAEHSKPKPFSAESNLVLTDQERGQRLILNEDEQAAALASLRSLAEEHEQVETLRPAEHGVRWRDVPLAARFAGEKVEIAIVRERRRPADDAIEFVMLTIDDRPARLIVVKTNDERVYEASATVGRLVNDEQRSARLLRAFNESMKALGRKRGF